MELLMEGLSLVMHWNVLLILCLGVILGIVIGALPGLTATMGVALLLPFTFGAHPVTGILLLIGVYCGGIYGGSISAILLRTPGTSAAAATVMDGYPLTQRGLGYKALTVSTMSSAIGGALSVIVLVLVAPELAAFSLRFSAPEMFALAVFGLSIISSISGESLLKGLISGLFGLLIATVGLDPMAGFPRYTFGQVNLMNGVELVPAVIGLFAASQAFRLMEDLHGKDVIEKVVQKVRLTWREFRGLITTILRSAGIGVFIGAMPGAGGDIAAFVAYNETRRFSRNKEEFGKGRLEGVAAPESANNASTGGAMIPLLSLGIPGDAVTAVLLGAFLVQGLQPGPGLFQNSGDIVHALFIGMFLANVLLLVFGLSGIRLFTKVLMVPKSVLVPVILVLCVVGSYTLGNNMFNVWVMLAAGVAGYLMERYGFPVSPIVLAIILGPMMESNLRRALIMSQGDAGIFFTRPISLILLIIAAATLLWPIAVNWRKHRKETQT